MNGDLVCCAPSLPSINISPLCFALLSTSSLAFPVYAVGHRIVLFNAEERQQDIFPAAARNITCFALSSLTPTLAVAESTNVRLMHVSDMVLRHTM